MEDLVTLISASSAVIAALGVLLVYRQLRLVEKSTIANTQARLIADDTDFWRQGLEDPSLAKEILSEKFGWDLSDDEFRRHLFVALLIDHYEKMYFQYRSGLFPKKLWAQWERSIVSTLNTKAAKPVWDSIKSAFLPEFVRRIDSLMD